GVARHADQPLDECTAAVTRRAACGGGGRLEYDDLAARRASEHVREPVRNDAVAHRREAAERRLRAVQRRLHRRRRDSVRLRDLGLEDEDEHDRDTDGPEPLDHPAPWLRDSLHEILSRSSLFTTFGSALPPVSRITCPTR